MASRARGEHVEAPVVVSALSKSFGEQKVLNGIDLSVASGETLAVLGRSGTGKSVLLKLMVGLQQPDSGSIRIQGQDVVGLAPDRLNEIRKKLGFLFQQAALYDSLTVEENVEFPLKRHTKLSTEERKARARELLENLGIIERDWEKMPSDISGGMQKRVGLARALALEPEILLFDEPMAGLDPITASEIGNLILDLKQKRELTSIVVTHDIHGAKHFCDRLVLMRDGRIVMDGKFRDFERSRDPFVSQFLRAAD